MKSLEDLMLLLKYEAQIVTNCMYTLTTTAFFQLKELKEHAVATASQKLTTVIS